MTIKITLQAIGTGRSRTLARERVKANRENLDVSSLYSVAFACVLPTDLLIVHE
jgi:hypothetical protein